MAFCQIRVIVLHPCTKFEVRRPSSSEDMTHFYLNNNPHGDLDVRYVASLKLVRLLFVHCADLHNVFVTYLTRG